MHLSSPWPPKMLSSLSLQEGEGGREEADKPTPADLNVVLPWDIVSKGLMIMYVC